MDSQQLIKDIIDSMCLSCAKRLLHFQLFTIATSSHTSSYYWIQEYLYEKKKAEQNSTDFKGCGLCFGLLEKYSHESYLREVNQSLIRQHHAIGLIFFNFKLADEIKNSGIQFKDFRISLTAPNSSALREVFINIIETPLEII